MITDSEALVLRQIKTAGGRRMIILLTKKYGKISAGTSISEGGKNKTALALRPFTYGRYELFKARDTYNINGAETLQSFFAIGEDVDKYMAASYVLELTDKMAPEDQPQPALLNLVKDFLSMLNTRKQAYGTLVIGFQLKALQLAGCAPQIGACISCGSTEKLSYFSVKDGGCLCENCKLGDDPMVFALTPDMMSAMKYIQAHPLRALEGIGLNEDAEKRLRRLMKACISYHLGINNLKSEALLI